MTARKAKRKVLDVLTAIPMSVDPDIGLRELARLCYALGIELRIGVRRMPKRCLAQRKKVKRGSV